jgi:hypothetical protein
MSGRQSREVRAVNGYGIYPEGEERKNGSKSAVCQIDLTVLLPSLFTVPSCAGLKTIPIFNEKSFCHRCACCASAKLKMLQR